METLNVVRSLGLVVVVFCVSVVSAGCEPDCNPEGSGVACVQGDAEVTRVEGDGIQGVVVVPKIDTEITVEASGEVVLTGRIPTPGDGWRLTDIDVENGHFTWVNSSASGSKVQLMPLSGSIFIAQFSEPFEEPSMKPQGRWDSASGKVRDFAIKNFDGIVNFATKQAANQAAKRVVIPTYRSLNCPGTPTAEENPLLNWRQKIIASFLNPYLEVANCRVQATVPNNDNNGGSSW